MQQSNGAGVRLVIPKEYQLTPPVRAPRKKNPFNERGCERSSSGAECGVTLGTRPLTRLLPRPFPERR